MKKVKLLFVALVASLIFASTAFAATDGASPESALRTQILKYIDQPYHSVFNGEDLVANLRLMINKDNEIIVIDSGTQNPLLDKYLKSHLNYKKVDADNINYFDFYFIKVEFKK